MTNKIFPKKLKKGDEVRIIVLSNSLALVSEENKKIANERLEDLGLKISFGKHVNEINDFLSTSIESRIEDFHDAFSDKNVKAVLVVLGGANANQMLSYVDWDIIKNNPKIFCGYSDVTIFNNSLYAKTGLVNYYGPFYSNFGQKLYFDYTLDYFKKCLFSENSYLIEPSSMWSDDKWYKDQENRVLVPNEGRLVLREGKASGVILGGNLCTLNLLQGTEYFPKFEEDTILFLEDNELTNSLSFDRDLQSLLHQANIEKIKGVVIGRFQKASGMTGELLEKIIKTKKELNNIPIVSNIDFGHTSPICTFPIGGTVKIDIKKEKVEIKIEKH